MRRSEGQRETQRGTMKETERNSVRERKSERERKIEREKK